MDDQVLREVTILIRDFRKTAQTLTHLRVALRKDPRFTTLRFTEGAVPQAELFENIKKGGPEDLTDPFSKPLVEDHD